LVIAWATVTAVRSAETGGGGGPVDALDQLDIVLLDEVEGEIALHRHRHLGEQVGGALAGVEERRLADGLRLGRVGGVELGGLVLELLVELLGDVDHLLELAHGLPHRRALGIDGGIVHEQLVLAGSEAGKDAGDVGLRALVFLEIIAELVAPGDDAQDLPRAAELALAAGVEVLDGAAKLEQVGADSGVLVDRLDRTVEETVRMAGGLGNLLAAHVGQLVDFLARTPGVGVGRDQLVDELVDDGLELRPSPPRRSEPGPAASAGSTVCSASGASSFSLVSVWVAILIAPLRFGAKWGRGGGERKGQSVLMV
jgi:hypothetical protein